MSEIERERMWRDDAVKILEELRRENFSKDIRIAALEADTKRLDFLDRVNTNLNKQYGTTYGWKFDVNHNRCRVWLEDMHIPALSVRDALDQAMTQADNTGAEHG